MSHVTTKCPGLACFAVSAPGLEPLVRRELALLEGPFRLQVEAPEPGGVPFRADLSGMYAANLHLRIASRVLVRVGSFHASAFHELERRARRLPWSDFRPAGAGVAFRVTSRKSKLYHQDAVTQRLEAIAGKGPANEAAEPQEFVVRLFRDECTVSADASGALLHRRGYRLATAKAPLRETLAAAMLAGAGWNGAVPLLDPLCGSGTILIEAALLARRIPPGLGRRFAFERWPGFDPDRWDRVVAAARERIAPATPAPILGSDRDAGAIAAASANARRAGLGRDIDLRRAAISGIEPPTGPGLILTNPPYGVRVGERARLRDLYAQLGNVARRKCAGWTVGLLTAAPELERQVGIPLTPRFTSENGGLRVRLVLGTVP
jgi:putative N6-adenine-specific DNA methylase